MKKVAFFVEGPTEADFVKRYLKEITSQKGLVITYEGFGGKQTPRLFQQTYTDGLAGRDYQINIYISHADNRVNSDVLDNLQSLDKSGFSLVIALKDLRGDKPDGTSKTLADLPRIENLEQLIFAKANPSVKSILAVLEIETWFIAETSHFQRIHSSLTQELIVSNSATLGVNPFVDNLTQIAKPAETLDEIYKLKKRRYDKGKKRRQRTINALDYANLYLNVPLRLAKFDEFAKTVDSIF